MVELSQNPNTIALVEDNAFDAELTQRVLNKQFPNLNVLRFTDGVSYLDFLREQLDKHPRHPYLFRATILDLKLPKLSGLEVLKSVKSNPILKVMPVVVLSSSREPKDIETAYQLGANSYVVKPLEYDKFTSYIVELGQYWYNINQPQAI